MGSADKLFAAMEETFPAAFAAYYSYVELLAEHKYELTMLAVHKQTNARCVMKRVLQTPTVTKSLRRLRGLDCAGIPIITDYMEQDGWIFYVYSFEEGNTLEAMRISGEVFDKAWCVRIAAKLCETVSFIHQQGIIHGDIKPSNVVIGKEGPVLIDFGISHCYNPDSEEKTAIIGTKAFAAPELGHLKTDYRYDVYSLGVLLSWMLTGQLESVEALRKVKDPRLRLILWRSTNYIPFIRFHSAKRMARALNRLLHRTRTGFAIAAAVCTLGICMFLLPKLYEPMLPDAEEEISAENVMFQNALIEETVRAQLSLTPKEEITEDMLSSITELYLNAHDVVLDQTAFIEGHYTNTMNPFDGAEDLLLFPELTNMNFKNYFFADLEFLRSLPKLVSLSCNNCEIRDLSGLPELEALNLTGVDVPDVSPISEMNSLESLYLTENGCTEYKVISDTRTWYTFLGFDEIKYTEILPQLVGKSIGELVLFRAGIRELEVLADLSLTGHLTLAGNPMLSLEGIEILEGVTVLDLRDTPVTDFSPLADLNSLHTLIVTDDQLPYVETAGLNELIKIECVKMPY